MKSHLSLTLVFISISNELFAAEAGMPQLDPKYWASQAFWLIVVFALILTGLGAALTGVLFTAGINILNDWRLNILAI